MVNEKIKVTLAYCYMLVAIIVGLIFLMKSR